VVTGAPALAVFYANLFLVKKNPASPLGDGGGGTKGTRERIHRGGALLDPPDYSAISHNFM